MFRFHGERQVTLGTHRKPIQINRGASWNTSDLTYLRASATDAELSDVRYPTVGFRTFLRTREVKP